MKVILSLIFYKKKVIVDFEVPTSIGDVKLYIKDNYYLPVLYQRIVHNGAVLDDNQNIGEFRKKSPKRKKHMVFVVFGSIFSNEFNCDVNDVIEHIISFLPIPDVRIIRQVNRNWRRLAVLGSDFNPDRYIFLRDDRSCYDVIKDQVFFQLKSKMVNFQDFERKYGFQKLDVFPGYVYFREKNLLISYKICSGIENWKVQVDSLIPISVQNHELKISNPDILSITCDRETDLTFIQFTTFIISIRPQNALIVNTFDPNEGVKFIGQFVMFQHRMRKTVGKYGDGFLAVPFGEMFYILSKKLEKLRLLVLEKPISALSEIYSVVTYTNERRILTILNRTVNIINPRKQLKQIALEDCLQVTNNNCMRIEGLRCIIYNFESEKESIVNIHRLNAGIQFLEVFEKNGEVVGYYCYDSPSLKLVGLYKEYKRRWDFNLRKRVILENIEESVVWEINIPYTPISSHPILSHSYEDSFTIYFFSNDSHFCVVCISELGEISFKRRIEISKRKKITNFYVNNNAGISLITFYSQNKYVESIIMSSKGHILSRLKGRNEYVRSPIIGANNSRCLMQ